MNTTTQFKGQLPRNLFLQGLSFLTNLGVGILLTPYLVGQLGRAAYGLIPIAGILTEYVGLVTQTIATATSRFLIIALQRDDTREANRVVNTAFFSYLALALLQIPIFGLILYHADKFFTIPAVLWTDALLLLACSAGSFLINLMTSVYAVPLYAHNRLDLARSLDIGRQIGRIAGILGLFLAFGPALRYVGYVDLALSFLAALATVFLGRRLAPMLRLTVSAYDWSKLRQILSVGGWLMVLYLGTLFSMRTDIWICNRFVGAEAAGEYAAVLQWSALIRQAGMVLAGVIGPMAIIYYARSEVEQLLRLTHVSIRFLSLLLAVPIAILCVFSSSILRFWLGESFVPLAPLMIIMLCHLTINVGVTPLFSTRLALNVIKIPGLVSCVTGVIGILVAIFFAYYLNWGIYGVAIATAVKLTLVNALWNPVYLASVLRQPWHTYLQPLFSGVVLLALMIMVGLGVKHLIPPTSWVKLLTGSLIMGLLGLMGIWLMLTARDRQLLVDLLPQRSRGAVGGHRQAWPRTVKAEHERVP